jgi:hypothetical protein
LALSFSSFSSASMTSSSNCITSLDVCSPSSPRVLASYNILTVNDFS